MNSTRSRIQAILSLGSPLVLTQILHFSHQVADSAMLGHYGQGSADLAAIGIAVLFTSILNTMIWPLATGVQAISARRYGEELQKREENTASQIAGAEEALQQSSRYTGETLDNGLFCVLYIAALAILLSFLAESILSALVQDSLVLERALSYIGIMRIALLPTGICIVLQSFLSAIHKTRYVMVSGALNHVLNIVLNYILIFGVDTEFVRIEALGIRGAAIGSVVAWLVSCVVLLVIFLRRGYARQYGALRFSGLRWSLQRDILTLALSPCVQNVFALSVYLVYQTIIEDYSALLLAATHAAFLFFRLNKTLIAGYARATGILIGNVLGSSAASETEADTPEYNTKSRLPRTRQQQEAQALMKAGWVFCWGIALVLAAGSLLGHTGISELFSGNTATQGAISQAILFFVAFFFVEALGYMFEMVFVANGYARVVLFSEVCTNVLFILAVPLIVRSLFPEDIRAVWLSFGLYQLFHSLVMIATYFRGNWLRARVERA